MPVRSPIVVTVGHIDAGKTTLLDCIRGSTVTAAEPGMLSQHVGASFVPIETVRRICGELLTKMKLEITIPGLLLLDTPGHAAFITLRRRGGSVSDLAILVVDITEGFQEQTDESLAVLKEFKTPFVVAATKIDKLPGWYPYKNECFMHSFAKQSEDVKEELDKKLYQLVAQLSERGMNSERFDRVDDFTKQVAIVPCSGTTGEGAPELLMVLSGLAQQFLKQRLEVSGLARGMILEVKDTIGLGTTVDVILYDGTIRTGDFMVIGGKQPVVTKVKVMLRPPSLHELRIEKKFESVNTVSAAAGIKIAAPNLENVISGSPVMFVSDEKYVNEARTAVQKEVEEVEFEKDVEGVVIKADTLGSLEAMIKLLTQEEIPIRKAEVGQVTKQDLIAVQNVKDELKRVILAFNVKTVKEAEDMATDMKIPIFQSNIIYRIMEEYKKWCAEADERRILQLLDKVVRPAEIKVLKGFVFRVSKPAIFGVEVLKGLLRPKALMKRVDERTVGRIKGLEREGKAIPEAKAGEKVAVSMDDVTIGRQVSEGDVLTTVLNEDDVKVLRELYVRLTDSEKEFLEELK
jgi:translation initiation factor 5B